jgi:16S rRNA (uracil1498-N3)-methyltransferase
MLKVPKRIPRVLLKHSVSVGDRVLPSRQQVHRLRRVLRLPKGARIRGLLPDGSSADLVFHHGKSEAAELEVLRVEETGKRGPSGLTIALSLIKRVSHVDFVIEKGTELGVAGWWSVQTARCADMGLLRAYHRRLARWQRITESAVLQSGQSSLPIVEGVFGWEEFLEASTAFSARIFGDVAATCERHRPVWDQQSGPALFLVGPEGGFSEQEVVSLKKAGFLEYWLGPSVLRAETAALVGAVLLLDTVDIGTDRPVL